MHRGNCNCNCLTPSSTCHTTHTQHARAAASSCGSGGALPLLLGPSTSISATPVGGCCGGCSRTRSRRKRSASGGLSIVIADIDFSELRACPALGAVVFAALHTHDAYTHLPAERRVVASRDDRSRERTAGHTLDHLDGLFGLGEQQIRNALPEGREYPREIISHETLHDCFK